MFMLLWAESRMGQFDREGCSCLHRVGSPRLFLQFTQTRVTYQHRYDAYTSVNDVPLRVAVAPTPLWVTVPPDPTSTKSKPQPRYLAVTSREHNALVHDLPRLPTPRDESSRNLTALVLNRAVRFMSSSLSLRSVTAWLFCLDVALKKHQQHFERGLSNLFSHVEEVCLVNIQEEYIFTGTGKSPTEY